MTTADEHEQKLLISFMLPTRQNRYLEKPKRRNDIIGSLAHFNIWTKDTRAELSSTSSMHRIF